VYDPGEEIFSFAGQVATEAQKPNHARNEAEPLGNPLKIKVDIADHWPQTGDDVYSLFSSTRVVSMYDLEMPDQGAALIPQLLEVFRPVLDGASKVVLVRAT
jgi:hypothetical protein